MKRLSTVLMVVAFLMVGEAQAHYQKSGVDGRNPNTPLDLKTVKMGHDENKLIFSAKTYGGFSPRVLRGRGQFMFSVWKKGRGYFFRTVVYRDGDTNRIRGRIHKIRRKDGSHQTVGWARGRILSSQMIGLNVKRDVVEANGKILWSAWSRWWKKDHYVFDRIPTKRGGMGHNLDS